MKLIREFKTDYYSTTYIWSAIIEGEELRYQISVNERRDFKIPVYVLENQARAAIMGTIQKKLFGE